MPQIPSSYKRAHNRCNCKVRKTPKTEPFYLWIVKLINLAHVVFLVAFGRWWIDFQSIVVAPRGALKINSKGRQILSRPKVIEPSTKSPLISDNLRVKLGPLRVTIARGESSAG